MKITDKEDGISKAVKDHQTQLELEQAYYDYHQNKKKVINNIKENIVKLHINYDFNNNYNYCLALGCGGCSLDKCVSTALIDISCKCPYCPYFYEDL